MKFNWVLYIVISAVLFIPLLGVADNGTTTGSTAENTSSEVNKPDNDEEDPLAEADVTIIKSQDRTIAEYRLNGRLVQVKITPKHGYSYYLIDTDGNGTLDVRSSDSWKNTIVHTWKIFQW